MGNICRSPTAEGVMRKYVKEMGLSGRIVVDSAATHNYHVGEAPDPRAQAAARKRGYDLSDLRARQIEPADFERFDFVLAMDFNNLADLQTWCPAQQKKKIELLMPYAQTRRATIVHDPYCRSTRDFDHVLDAIEDACRGLLGTIVGDYGVTRQLNVQRKSKLKILSNAWAFPTRIANFRL